MWPFFQFTRVHASFQGPLPILNQRSVFSLENTKKTLFFDVFKGNKMGASVWNALNLSWRRPLLSRNQSIDLLCKSIDWFLYDRDLRHERVKGVKLKQWRKKRLRHRCFSVNITKFLRTPFFIEHHRWLLLSHSLVFYRLSCSENFSKVHMKASVKRTPSQAFS